MQFHRLKSAESLMTSTGQLMIESMLETFLIITDTQRSENGNFSRTATSWHPSNNYCG